MFQYCILPAGFTLSDDFDTSEVENMGYMFSNCALPDGFSLGNNFDTSKVKNMQGMFSHCRIPEGFSLSEKFDTGNVTEMAGMFEYSTLPESFVLNENFLNFDKVSEKDDCPETIEENDGLFDAYGMFTGAILPEGREVEEFKDMPSLDVCATAVAVNVVEWLKSREPAPSSEKPASISIEEWKQVYDLWNLIADLCINMTEGYYKGEFSFLIARMMQYAAARITNSGNSIVIPIMYYTPSEIKGFVLEYSPDYILEFAMTPRRHLIPELVWGDDWQKKYVNDPVVNLGCLTGPETVKVEADFDKIISLVYDMCKFMTGNSELEFDEDCCKCIAIAFTMILSHNGFTVAPQFQDLEKIYPASEFTTKPEYKDDSDRAFDSLLDGLEAGNYTLEEMFNMGMFDMDMFD